MKKSIYIVAFLLAYCGNITTPHAFVIFDGATQVTHILEGVSEWAKTTEEKISAHENKMKSSRIGKMGRDAKKYYNKASSFLRKDRKLAGMKLPGYLSNVATSIDGVYDNVSKNYLPNFGEGNTSAVKNYQTRHNLEIQHNQIAEAYAKAFAIRNILVKERNEKKEASEGGQSNSREIVDIGRAYNEKMAQRYSDILSMESAMLDMENTYILMSSDPQRLERARETNKKGDKK